MKLRNKKTGEIITLKDEGELALLKMIEDSLPNGLSVWEEVKEPLIKDEKIRKAVRAWAEAENYTGEMSLYYTLNRQEKYITFHNPQTGSELQLCDFDSPVFQELREYTIAELCGEEEE